MDSKHFTPSQSKNGPAASSQLLASAIAGLLGIAGCGDNHAATIGDSEGSHGNGAHEHAQPDTPAPPADADGPSSNASDGGVYTNVLSTTAISFTDFSALCEARGGFVTTNANCAGSNLCKGLSYADDGTVLTDHSCRGLNSCTGISCVDLPKGSGLTGEDIYQNGPCGGCHNDAFEGPPNYVIFVHPGTAPPDAVAQFERSSLLRLSSIVAFGTQGVNDDGVAFSNMPSYRDKYSREEIESVVTYLRGLESHTKVYSIPGEEFPDAGK